jgi:NADH-quinone oxidoreductase subunit I
MGAGGGLARSVVAGVRRIAARPLTIRYPHERELPVGGARGSIGLLAERCIVCRRCEDACPTRCIDIAGEAATEPPGRLDRFVLDLGACVTCGRCVEVCPTDALEWWPDDEHAALNPEVLQRDIRFVERGDARSPVDNALVAKDGGVADVEAEGSTS